MNVDEQALRRVLSVLSLAQLVHIANRVEQIAEEPGHGKVTILIRDGFVRYIVTETSVSEVAPKKE